MVTYIIRRLFGAVLMLVAVSFCTFMIFFGLPRLAGATPESFAARYVGKTSTPETVALAAERLGFHDSLWVQYGRWLRDIVMGADYNYGPGVEHCSAPCFGYSFITHQPVWLDILDRLPVTVSLALGAAILWLLGGVATGVVSALKRGSIFDRASMGIALSGVSLPIFFTGLFALTFLSYGAPPLYLDITAKGGAFTPITENPIEWAYNLILPWITLAFIYAAGYARITRAGMLETMGEDYIRTARAKGLRERTVITRHGLRAALTPIVTIFGLDLGLLLGGAVLTESTFSLQGVGKYTIDAIFAQDMPKIMGVTMVAAFFVVIANLIVDVMYAVVDPRVRLS
ncbi:ABC transporter permease [Catellatospora sp. TT07R-123]|uniref:ABC transporter permease n=1 Tax=Catellatospora sp. TT07R-123 TaxID=2733863 RepID=UPI001B089FA3|nr:ABC transporter permease [Catellatospora sp. TT07R-123]GHJ46521.1 ABC transporter permease [Catellatospora sp. TT07R-123]